MQKRYEVTSAKRIFTANDFFVEGKKVTGGCRFIIIQKYTSFYVLHARLYFCNTCKDLEKRQHIKPYSKYHI